MMSPIKTIKLIPGKSIYKILDIVTHNALVWQILDKYISNNFVRSVYLRELLIAVMLCGDIKNGYSVHKCEDRGLEKGIVKHGKIRMIHIFGYDLKWNSHGHFIVT